MRAMCAGSTDQSATNLKLKLKLEKKANRKMNQLTKAASSAVASLSNLKTGLQNVSSTITAAGGDPFLRLLTDGDWVYGAENVEVEEGSHWAINPLSLMHGYISWTDHPGKQANEVVGEVMVPMTSGLPPKTELNDTGWGWDQQLMFQLKCMDGEDVGTQVIYKTTSVGGMSACKALIAQIMKQLDVDPERPVPIIQLQSDSYTHKKWGKTYTPIFDVVKWVEMSDAGAEEAGQKTPAQEAPEPEEQPKARTRKASAKTEPKQEAETRGVPADDKSAKKAALMAELERLAAEDADEGAEEPEPTNEAPQPRRRRRG